KPSRLYLVAVKEDREGKRTPRRLTTGDRSVSAGPFAAAPFDWSPDGKTIVFSHTRSPKVDDWPSADLSLVDVESGTVKPLVQTGAAETTPRYSPDGRSIAYVATDDPPTWAHRATVHVVHATGGQPRALAATFDHQPGLLGWSGDGRRLYVTE